jgi:hypothetical protein
MPRKVPCAIPVEKVNEAVRHAKPKIKAVLYVGWARRKVNGKKALRYLAATGNTAGEARNNFKHSQEFGENIWLID